MKIFVTSDIHGRLSVAHTLLMWHVMSVILEDGL